MGLSGFGIPAAQTKADGGTACSSRHRLYWATTACERANPVSRVFRPDSAHRRPRRYLRPLCTRVFCTETRQRKRYCKPREQTHSHSPTNEYSSSDKGTEIDSRCRTPRQRGTASQRAPRSICHNASRCPGGSQLTEGQTRVNARTADADEARGAPQNTPTGHVRAEPSLRDPLAKDEP